MAKKKREKSSSAIDIRINKKSRQVRPVDSFILFHSEYQR